MAEFLRQRRFTAAISVIGVLFGDFYGPGWLSLRVEFPSFVDHLVFNPFCFKVYLLSAVHIPSCSSVTLFVLNSPACFVDHLVFNPFCL